MSSGLGGVALMNWAQVMMRRRRMVRPLALIAAISIGASGLVGCEGRRCGSAPVPGQSQTAHRSESALVLAEPAAAPDVRPPKPPKQKPCPPKSAKQDKKEMRGAKGQQIISQTLYRGAVGQYRYRLDVENPAPGKRPGSLHVQLGGKGSTHYEYNSGSKKFVSRSGERLPRQVQDAIDKDPVAQRMIKRGLQRLGER